MVMQNAMDPNVPLQNSYIQNIVVSMALSGDKILGDN